MLDHDDDMVHDVRLSLDNVLQHSVFALTSDIIGLAFSLAYAVLN